jgi:raffinose/stachyose/melibiose transport system substrate-binding protein
MKRFLGSALILLLVLVLAGCVAPATTPPAAGDAAATATGEAAASEGAAGQGAVTLRVMDQFTDEGKNAAVEKLDEMFMAKYPDIKVQREAVTSDDMRTIVQTALATNDAPDVIYYDTGPGFAGVIAKAGLIRPIDDLYTQYNWDQRIFPWTKARTTFDGKVYGVGNELEFLGGYYNKTLFDQLGLSVPKTYEDLLAVCKAAQDNGLVAITFGDQAKWPAYHAFSMAANNVLGKEKLDTLLFGDGRWDDPQIVDSIRIWFDEMNKDGCFEPDPSAVTYDDANTLFYSGQALMNFTGTWLMNDVLENMKDYEVGWLFFPSVGGNPVLPPAGLGSGYFVSSKSQNVDAAGKYLDFLYSQEAAKVWMEQGKVVLPMDVDTSGFDLPDLFLFAVDALATQEMGYNIDVLTPDNFNNMMGDGFQAVMLGEKTPEQQAADLQAAWEQAISEGKISR